MTGHPYRESEQVKRGPLTRGERAAAAFKGLLCLEPLLEQHRFGLDPKNCLPLDERLKHARKVAASDSVENIARFIESETSHDIKKLLESGFLLSFSRKYQKLHDSVCDSESGMAAISGLRERDQFKESSLELVKTLLSKGRIELDTAREMTAFINERGC
jgi:hypothetical protein